MELRSQPSRVILGMKRVMVRVKYKYGKNIEGDLITIKFADDYVELYREEHKTPGTFYRHLIKRNKNNAISGIPEIL